MDPRQKLYALFFSQDSKNSTLAFELAKAEGIYEGFVTDLYDAFSQALRFQEEMKFYETFLASDEDKLDEITLKRAQLEHLSETFFDTDLDLSQERPYSLENAPISSFPKVLLHFSFLTELDLSWNNFECLPLDMSGLGNLKKLILRGSKPLKAPIKGYQGLSTLPNLETLILDDCGDLFHHKGTMGRLILKLPRYFRKFTQLKTLELENSVLYSFPDWIHELKSLECVKMEVYNWAEAMYPPDFSFPENFGLLPHLRELSVTGQYEVCSFPNIGKLTQLRKLTLHYVANRFWQGMPNLKKLEYLDLSNLSRSYPLIHQGKRVKHMPRGASRIQVYGLEWLKEMTSLQEFRFVQYEKHRRFTDSDKQELAQALPNCKFVYE